MKRYSGFKLLIVDDNQHNLFTLGTLIRAHMDIEILEATSGQQALDIALGDTGIDLIVLDIQMPEIDGFQTASMLKIRKKTRDIPIIFLTAAFKTDEFQQKGYDVGAVDYLLKPIDDNQLINKISTYFRLIEKERNLNKIISSATILAIIVSSLGLFGLSFLTLKARTKEIGIRKALGASFWGLFMNLIKDYLVIILISTIIALPIAYFFIQKWLEEFEFKMTVLGFRLRN